MDEKRGAEVVDTDALLANLGDDRELAVQLLTQLASDLGARAGELQDVLDGSSAEEVHRVAHALKGALSSACAHEARDRVRDLDEAARQGDFDGALALWPAARAALHRLQEALADPRAMLDPR